MSAGLCVLEHSLLCSHVKEKEAAWRGRATRLLALDTYFLLDTDEDEDEQDGVNDGEGEKEGEEGKGVERREGGVGEKVAEERM